MLSFERRYTVADAELPPGYLGARKDWFATASTLASAFGLKEDVQHDALLLLDRSLAAGGEQLLGGVNAGALVLACLLTAARQAGEGPERLPSPASLEVATGVSAAEVEGAQDAVRGVLQGNTSAISGRQPFEKLCEDG